MPLIDEAEVADQRDADREKLDKFREEVRGLREELWERLPAGVPGLVRTGRPQAGSAARAADTLPNTLHVRFPGVIGASVLARCPDLAASTGSACDAGTHTPSASLLAIGLAPDDALGAVRLSLGCGSTPEEVRAAASELVAAWQALNGHVG